MKKKAKKLYTANELRQFDRLTLKLSNQDQMVRLNARLIQMPAFVKKHGKKKCAAMFKVLKERDERL